jgi:hypothetical protein
MQGLNFSYLHIMQVISVVSTSTMKTIQPASHGPICLPHTCAEDDISCYLPVSGLYDNWAHLYSENLIKSKRSPLRRNIAQSTLISISQWYHITWSRNNHIESSPYIILKQAHSCIYKITRKKYTIVTCWWMNILILTATLLLSTWQEIPGEWN